MTLTAYEIGGGNRPSHQLGNLAQVPTQDDAWGYIGLKGYLTDRADLAYVRSRHQRLRHGRAGEKYVE